MIQILVLVLLISLNAFFAAAEMAFVSLNDAKIEKQAKLRKKTIKAVKEHFNINDIDLIEKELLELGEMKECGCSNNKKVEEIILTPDPNKEQKFLPKLKTNITARPIFKNNYERYEWHMQNGCVGSDDRKWLADYIKSEEFKDIYN